MRSFSTFWANERTDAIQEGSKLFDSDNLCILCCSLYIKDHLAKNIYLHYLNIMQELVYTACHSSSVLQFKSGTFKCLKTLSGSFIYTRTLDITFRAFS